MGYSEKRGNLWRARWRAPDGKLESEPGFRTKKEADKCWQGHEADIRAGRYVDPRAGQITVGEWLDIWFNSLDLEESTLENYRFVIENCILPYFKDRTLASLTIEEITAWERDLVKVDEYAKSTAKGARARLSTALAAAIPARIQFNPAAKPRRTGRKADRRIEQVMEKRKAWTTPLEALLLAERIGLIGGEELFIKTIFAAYTGARWSEIIGLDPGCFHPDDNVIDLDWKLYELSGRFYRGRPKDGSIRTVGLPPFLTDLLKHHLKDRNTRCVCSKETEQPYCDGTANYVFLRPNRSHYSRSDFATGFFRPAADGWWPERTGKRARPSMPVLADVTRAWAGVPCIPWPAAVKGQPFEVPKGRRHALRNAPTGLNSRSPRAALAERAISEGMSAEEVQALSREQLLDRLVRSSYASQEALVSWAPIMRDLTVHGLRHAMETWMVEDRIPKVLRDERMGHLGQGDIADRYTHPTDGMHEELSDALQQRWEGSLSERVAMESVGRSEFPVRSGLPLLETFLEPLRSKPAPVEGRRRGLQSARLTRGQRLLAVAK